MPPKDKQKKAQDKQKAAARAKVRGEEGGARDRWGPGLFDRGSLEGGLAAWVWGGGGRGAGCWEGETRRPPQSTRPVSDPSPPSPQVVEDKTFGLKNKKKSAKVQK